MKCITLHQPWASLMATGVKKIETRSWKTSYRGPLAIHASKRKIEMDNDTVRDIAFAVTFGRDECVFPHGAIVGVCNLVDCIQMNIYTVANALISVSSNNELLYGQYGTGRYMWITENMIEIEPIPYRGQQGLWNIPDELSIIRKS